MMPENGQVEEHWIVKTDYEGHDRIYKRLKASGKQGWADADQLQEYIQALDGMLSIDGVPSAGRALELGCGDGRNSVHLARRGFHVSGLDIAPSAIDWARETARDAGVVLDLHTGSVVDVAVFQNNSFDLVVDGHCAHCIIGDDRKAMFASVYRVLRPGGAFLLTTMCGELGSLSVPYFDAASRCVIRDGVAQRYIGDPEMILEEVRTAGLCVSWSRLTPLRTPDECDDLLAVAFKP